MSRIKTPGQFIVTDPALSEEERAAAEKQALMDWASNKYKFTKEPIVSDPAEVGKLILDDVRRARQQGERQCSKCVWFKGGTYATDSCAHPVVAHPRWDPATGRVVETPRPVYQVRSAQGQCGVEGRMFLDAKETQRDMRAELPLHRQAWEWLRASPWPARVLQIVAIALAALLIVWIAGDLP